MSDLAVWVLVTALLLDGLVWRLAFRELEGRVDALESADEAFDRNAQRRLSYLWSHRAR